MKITKILVFGVSGMLGNAVFRVFCSDGDREVFGTLRDNRAVEKFSAPQKSNILAGIDVNNVDHLAWVMAQVEPDLVVNCIGLVKQVSAADDPLEALPINSIFPHRLARLCSLSGARLVHISTDCVFAGTRGNYKEEDFADAGDLYGRSKYLGEVDYPNAVTLRTSIIGHELSGARSLLNWFLAQEGEVKGFRKAIFSGLPTNELSHVIRDVVLTHPELHGVYHVAARPIDKYSLLKLVADIYGKQIRITADDDLEIDRSLSGEKFRKATGYVAPDWPELIKQMHDFHKLGMLDVSQ